MEIKSRATVTARLWNPYFRDKMMDYVKSHGFAEISAINKYTFQFEGETKLVFAMVRYLGNKFKYSLGKVYVVNENQIWEMRHE